MSDNSRLARSPFQDVSADIILRTSNGVNFRVFQSTLILSSPFYRDMLSLPQPPDLAENGQPIVIDVPEDSITLDTLLRFLYPNTPTPSFRDVFHARDVAAAASKYDMTVALDKMVDKIQIQYAASQPLQVYFIACQMGWEGAARAAARNCFDLKMIEAGEDEDEDESENEDESGSKDKDKNKNKDEDKDDDPTQHNLLEYPGAAIAYHRLEEYRVSCYRAMYLKMIGARFLNDPG